LSNSPLVAVVDDDAAVREALSDLLQVLGLACRSFRQAEAFLEAFVPGLFDGLVTDIRMPGMGGLELLRRMRALAPSMPVIVITSITDPAIHRAVLGHGALALLTKPIVSDELIRHLKALGYDGGPDPGGGELGS
jgi:two-component system response regulator FixJ